MKAVWALRAFLKPLVFGDSNFVNFFFKLKSLPRTNLTENYGDTYHYHNNRTIRQKQIFLL